MVKMFKDIPKENWQYSDGKWNKRLSKQIFFFKNSKNEKYN